MHSKWDLLQTLLCGSGSPTDRQTYVFSPQAPVTLTSVRRMSLMADAHNLPARSDGLTYDRWTAFKLMEGTYNMPGTRRFTLLADNIDFRRRLRQAHPDTEATCLQRRQDCFRVRAGYGKHLSQRVPIKQCCQSRARAICTAGIGNWHGLSDPDAQVAPGHGWRSSHS